VLVRHAHRIKALLFAEVKGFQRKTYCAACSPWYHEWFQINIERAIKVIERWTAWAKTCPYDDRDSDAGQSKLRDWMEGRIVYRLIPIIDCKGTVVKTHNRARKQKLEPWMMEIDSNSNDDGDEDLRIVYVQESFTHGHHSAGGTVTVCPDITTSGCEDIQEDTDSSSGTAAECTDTILSGCNQ